MVGGCEKNKPKQSQFALEAEPAEVISKATGIEAATKSKLKKQSQFATGL
jgi:hypothetical protein